jgi:hypothetical protein
MALIDTDWWKVRRKLTGAAGASQVMSSQPAPLGDKRVPYIRLRPTTTKSNTPRQCAQRALWAYLSHAWTTELNDAERYSWQDVLDFSGQLWWDEEQQQRHLCGYELFAGTNARRLAAGFPLNKDGYYVDLGIPLTSIDVTFLDDAGTQISVDFLPSAETYYVLLLYMRGPSSPGTHAVVPAAEFWRASVPSRWRLIGYGPYEAASPLTFTLPRAVPIGRKLAVAGQLMDRSGFLAPDWLLDELVHEAAP